MPCAGRERQGRQATGGTMRNGKPGRPRRSASLNRNPFLNMPIAKLFEEKRRLEEAWRVARKMLR